MDKKLKTKWLRALRSGKYKQARGRLHRGDGYCCLGVLCVVAGMKPDAEGLFDGHGMVLPRRIEEASGVLDNGELPKPVIWKGREIGCLAELNDAGASFKRLATIIEEQL